MWCCAVACQRALPARPARRLPSTMPGNGERSVGDTVLGTAWAADGPQHGPQGQCNCNHRMPSQHTSETTAALTRDGKAIDCVAHNHP